MSFVLNKLEKFKPLSNFNLGHTPFQIEHFKTSSQNGDRKFEYWQHIIQLKSLKKALKELELEIEDVSFQIEDNSTWFPPWNMKTKKRKLPKLKWKLECLKESAQEKEIEASRHLELLDSKYKDLFPLTEKELFAGEADYWVMRLSKQIAAGHLASKLGVSSGDITAISNMPLEQRKKIVLEMQKKPDSFLLDNK